MHVRSVGLLAALWVVLAGGVISAAPWSQAIGPRQWDFPRDFGAHPQYATEWWYFTGNLEAKDGFAFGYQFTIFRVGLRPEPTNPENPWSLRDLYLGHLALTDVAERRFSYAERLSRAGPGLAGASTEGMDVWLLDWSARMQDGRIRLRAEVPAFGLELELEPVKPVVLHGDHGLSRKGPEPGQASYYASFTRLRTRGRVRSGADGTWVPVTGSSWFDQEFGSNQLAEDQAGWDWFSLQLSDGRDLMIYFLRRRDGAVEPASSGTLVEPDGSRRHLALDDVEVRVLDHWRSPHSGGIYPSRWSVRVPSEAIRLQLEPVLPDQELVTEGSAGVTYWEGAVVGEGESNEVPVTCRGYVEMTGYAGHLGGLF